MVVNAVISKGGRLEFQIKQIRREDGSLEDLQSPIGLELQKVNSYWLWPAIHDDHDRTMKFPHCYIEKGLIMKSFPNILGMFHSVCGPNSIPHQLDSDGNAIRDSNGKCCNVVYRGNAMDRRSESIGAKSSVFIHETTSHAANRVDLFFKGYTLEAPRMVYELIARVTYQGKSNVIRLKSPSQKIALHQASNEFPISFKLQIIGELSSGFAPPDNAGRWLLVPHEPQNNPYVQEKENYMLLVPSSMVSQTGECDKIGVTPTTFRGQGEFCQRDFGSCLKNQICHIMRDDLDLWNDGKQTRFLIRTDYRLTLDERQQEVLRKPVQYDYPTNILLEMDADDLSIVRNHSPAKIVSFSVDTFTSGSQSGNALVTIKNMGDLEVSKHVSWNCSQHIIAPGHRQVLFGPSQTKSEEFDLRTNRDDDVADFDHYCTVYLFDEDGHEDDRRFLRFNTTKPNWESSDEVDPDVVEKDVESTGGLFDGLPDFAGISLDDLFGSFDSGMIIIFVLVVVGLLGFCCCTFGVGGCFLLNPSSFHLLLNLFCLGRKVTNATTKSATGITRKLSRNLDGFQALPQGLSKEFSSNVEEEYFQELLLQQYMAKSRGG